jgi:hypothetical protein
MVEKVSNLKKSKLSFRFPLNFKHPKPLQASTLQNLMTEETKSEKQSSDVISVPIQQHLILGEAQSSITIEVHDKLDNEQTGESLLRCIDEPVESKKQSRKAVKWLSDGKFLSKEDAELTFTTEWRFRRKLSGKLYYSCCFNNRCKTGIYFFLLHMT